MPWMRSAATPSRGVGAAGRQAHRGPRSSAARGASGRLRRFANRTVCADRPAPATTILVVPRLRLLSCRLRLVAGGAYSEWARNPLRTASMCSWIRRSVVAHLQAPARCIVRGKPAWERPNGPGNVLRSLPANRPDGKPRHRSSSSADKPSERRTPRAAAARLRMERQPHPVCVTQPTVITSLMEIKRAVQAAQGWPPALVRCNRLSVLILRS
jgi:hypothetical protein